MNIQKIFLIIAMLLFVRSISAQENQNAMMKACDNLDKVAAIASQINYIPWQTIQYTPSGPIPGILIASLQPESALLDFCAMYNHMKLLKGAELGMSILEAGNKLTGKKFDDHYNMLADTYNLGTSIDNLSRVDGDALTKAQNLAPNLNSFLGSANQYYNKQTDSESETFTSRNERESNMNRLLGSAARIASIQDLVSCPTKKKDNTELFSRDTATKQEEMNYLKGDIDFLHGSLERMGIKMSVDTNDFKKYLTELNAFFEGYAQYDISERSYTKESVERVKLQGKLSAEQATTKEVKKQIKSQYQVFSVRLDENVYELFNKKWSKNWKDVLLANTFSETKGLFMKKQGGSVEDEYRDIYFECRDSQMYRQTKESKPEYFVSLDDSRGAEAIREIREHCLKEQREALKNVPNLLAYYIEQAKETIVRAKKLQGDIWTIDSYYNGTVRVVDKGQVKNAEGQITSKQEVSCSDTLNATELQSLRLKAKSEIVNLRSNLAEEMVKKTARMKAKEVNFKKDIESSVVSNSIKNEKMRNDDTDLGAEATKRPNSIKGLK